MGERRWGGRGGGKGEEGEERGGGKGEEGGRERRGEGRGGGKGEEVVRWGGNSHLKNEVIPSYKNLHTLASSTAISSFCSSRMFCCTYSILALTESKSSSTDVTSSESYGMWKRECVRWALVRVTYTVRTLHFVSKFPHQTKEQH